MNKLTVINGSCLKQNISRKLIDELPDFIIEALARYNEFVKKGLTAKFVTFYLSACGDMFEYNYDTEKEELNCIYAGILKNIPTYRGEYPRTNNYALDMYTEIAKFLLKLQAEVGENVGFALKINDCSRHAWLSTWNGNELL
jgi:hypothetical protein